MKHVVGVSLGSSTRNHSAEITILNSKCKIERIGTDGSIEKAIALIKELDGKVDAFGLGGIDLYVYAGEKRYTFRDARKIADAACKTPIVDGSGLKDTLERLTINYLIKQGYKIEDAKVLMVCGADRYGMAESFCQAGANVTFGDLMFPFGIPIPIKSLETLNRAIRVIAPIACNLPFRMLYPTGEKQEKTDSKFERFFRDAEIIAGDFHFIRRYMPASLEGKTVITNTITLNDLELLKKRGVKELITTTPEIGGRSFGTNVMEGLLVAVVGKEAIDNPEVYYKLLKQINFKPRIVKFEREEEVI